MDLPPPPAGDVDGVARWVREHLGDLARDDVAPSPAFRGGQRAADAALAAVGVSGYARRRSEVWPPERRGASQLSPYIRHGLIDLPRAWDAVADGPARDVGRFRDELLWQEYARHLYARLGARLGRPLRAEPPAPGGGGAGEPWDRRMACMELTAGELERDGWLVNQTRMWLASQWSVRHGRDWRLRAPPRRLARGQPPRLAVDRGHGHRPPLRLLALAGREARPRALRDLRPLRPLPDRGLAAEGLPAPDRRAGGSARGSRSCGDGRARGAVVQLGADARFN